MNGFIPTDIQPIVGVAPVAFQQLDGFPTLAITDVDVLEEPRELARGFLVHKELGTRLESWVRQGERIAQRVFCLREPRGSLRKGRLERFRGEYGYLGGFLRVLKGVFEILLRFMRVILELGKMGNGIN
jgi:hypothetical protein